MIRFWSCDSFMTYYIYISCVSIYQEVVKSVRTLFYKDGSYLFNQAGTKKTF